MPEPPDIAFVALGTTPGLRQVEDAFCELVEAAGLRLARVQAQLGATGRLRRQITVTDFVEALAARRAARGLEARAYVYSTVTASLLQPRRTNVAIRFDSPAARNRPGAAGAWQRARERRVLGLAHLLLPQGDAARAVVPTPAQARTITLRVPIELPHGETRERDIDAVAYAGYPEKRGLDLLVRAWARAAGPGRRLVVTGVERERATTWLRGRGIDAPAGIEWRGLLNHREWQATLARTRLFVNASRREDYGVSQLEALAAGARLVTVPSPGPYEALPLARDLDPRLVADRCDADALAIALVAAFESEAGDYARRAARLLEPYGRDQIQRVFETEVLPALNLR